MSGISLFQKQKKEPEASVKDEQKLIVRFLWKTDTTVTEILEKLEKFFGREAESRFQILQCTAELGPNKESHAVNSNADIDKEANAGSDTNSVHHISSNRPPPLIESPTT